MTASIVALTALGGCGKKAEESSAPSAARDEAVVAGGPDINPQAAPGVAFRYSYDFVLPDKGIKAVLGAHAEACERLGPSQCRITGLRYTLLDDERISAQLQLKLAPQLARAFGENGIAAVEKASGKLVNEQIDGDDVSTTIEGAQRASADAATRLAEIETKLKAGGLKDVERSELEAQAAQLRDQIASAKDAKAVAEAQLANTPMTFNYAGDIGFSFGGNPLGDALHSAWSSFSAMIWFVLMGIGIVLPWVLLLALVIFLWRSRPGTVLRSFFRGVTQAKPPAENSN